MSTQTESVSISRYERIHSVVSSLNIFDDLLESISFLNSRDYTEDLLVKEHGHSASEAKKRAPSIRNYVASAKLFVEQAISGPEEVSFLPAYYAALNLCKAYVAFGPHFSALATNRWHGATYDVNGKDSHSLMTEYITLKPFGALPLFYRTLTGNTFSADRWIKLSDILPYIPVIETEYGYATGAGSALARLNLGAIKVAGGYEFRCYVPPINGNPIKSVRQIPALKKFRKPKGKAYFVYGPVNCKESELEDEARKAVVTSYLYGRTNEISDMPTCGSALPLPEEFPIVLLFFYMGSVVRYRPEFHNKLRDSKYWPVLAVARRHCLMRFLNLFWSFANQHEVEFVSN